MKTDLIVNDYCYFIYGAKLLKGIVLRVNRTTVTVKCPADGWFKEFTKRVNPDRVAYYQDEFTCVWDCSGKSPEGKYYITYDEFPADNKTGGHWSQPFMYVQK